MHIDTKALNEVYEVRVEGREYPWSGSLEYVTRKRTLALFSGQKVGEIERTVDRIEREAK